MKSKLLDLVFSAVAILPLISLQNNSFAQSAQLVFGTTSAVYVNINGGTVTTPIYLVLDNTATTAIVNASSSNRWIISEGDYNFLKRNMGATNGSYIYPFGYSTSAYIPFTYNKTSGNANLAASTYGTAAANTPLANAVTNMNPSGPASDANNMVVDRWWRLKQENGVSAPVADLTFSYRGAENTIAGISCPAEVLTAQYWGTNWMSPVLAPGSACATSGIATAFAAGVSVFTTASSQPFILTKSNAPLPVEFISFNAGCDNEKVKITWSTAIEQNSDYFTVEKSIDGTNFSSIASVPAAGNSSTVKDYSAVDTDPYSGGISFYRVRETDLDGNSIITDLVTVGDCGNDNIFIYSNGGSIYVNITASSEQNYEMELYNVHGQKLNKQTRNFVTGNNNIILLPNDVATGIYFVSAKNNQHTITKKVFVRSGM